MKYFNGMIQCRCTYMNPMNSVLIWTKIMRIHRQTGVWCVYIQTKNGYVP